MKPLQGLIAAGALVFPVLGFARGDVNETTRCYAAHFVRVDPAINLNELRQTVIFFNNGDLEHPAVIERLTVRNAAGAVIHDSGPRVGVPHPLNTAAMPPLDITTVAPGATNALGTFHIWRNATAPGGFYNASALSITVEVSKPGNRKLFVVHARENTRELVGSPNPIQGAERTANPTQCFRVTEGDD
jgi:hypothetical protein